MFFSLHNKTFSLSQEDISFEVPLKKVVFTSIHLTFHPFWVAKETMVQMVAHFLWGKCLFIINTLFLCKSFFHEPWFVLFNWAILFVLFLVDPFKTNWFGSKWRIHQIPCSVFYDLSVYIWSWVTLSRKVRAHFGEKRELDPTILRAQSRNF